jgi:hypothetical protein
VFLIIVYGYCSKKLEVQNRFYVETRVGGGKGKGWGSGGEMAQTIYAHMNK